MMKHKLLILLASLCLALCLLPGKTFALDTGERSDISAAALAGDSDPVTWTDFDNSHYTLKCFETSNGFIGVLNDNDTLTITGYSGVIGSDMLSDAEVDQYFAYAAELDITLETKIKKTWEIME